MVNSNEHGRALEYKVAIEIEDYLKKTLRLDVISSDSTKRLNFRDKLYFDVLNEPIKKDFSLCSATFVKWFSEQDWLKDAITVTIDRFGDDKAKKADPTDIQLGISTANGQLIFKNLSIKHHHEALKHPRLPSLAQQCGMEKGTKEDIEYRERYVRIWENFGKRVSAFNPKINTFSQLDKIAHDFKAKNLYVPLMKNAVDFLIAHSKYTESATSLFEYLVGKTNYIVVKNGHRKIEIKYFSKVSLPKKYLVTYPYNNKKIDSRSNLLLEFENGWKIKVRIHNASGRIFKETGKVNDTEKMDPICINLAELIRIEKIPKLQPV